MAKPATPLPDIVRTGEALASVNDWRAILIVAIVLISTLIGFIIWREFSLTRLSGAIDKVSDALWALKLSIAEERVLNREERVKASDERSELRSKSRRTRDDP